MMKQFTPSEDTAPFTMLPGSHSGGRGPVPPRYNLDPAELEDIERRLTKDVVDKLGNVYAAAWVGPEHEYANLLRTHEASYFPEVASLDADDESSTMFLALVDNREDPGSVVHGATTTRWSGAIDIAHPITNDQRTGFYTVDSLIELGNFTPQEFVDYYSQAGIDVARSMAVETNFIIKRGAQRFNGLNGAQLTYVTVIGALEQGGAEAGRSAVFATINAKQQLSFSRYGLTYEPLMGRTDMVTEEGQLGKLSLPVCVPYDANAQAVLKGYGVELPSIAFI